MTKVTPVKHVAVCSAEVAPGRVGTVVVGGDAKGGRRVLDVTDPSELIDHFVNVGGDLVKGVQVFSLLASTCFVEGLDLSQPEECLSHVVVSWVSDLGVDSIKHILGS